MKPVAATAQFATSKKRLEHTNRNARCKGVCQKRTVVASAASHGRSGGTKVVHVEGVVWREKLVIDSVKSVVCKGAGSCWCVVVGKAEVQSDLDEKRRVEKPLRSSKSCGWVERSSDHHFSLFTARGGGLGCLSVRLVQSRTSTRRAPLPR